MNYTVYISSLLTLPAYDVRIMVLTWADSKFNNKIRMLYKLWYDYRWLTSKILREAPENFPQKWVTILNYFSVQNVGKFRIPPKVCVCGGVQTDIYYVLVQKKKLFKNLLYFEKLCKIRKLKKKDRQFSTKFKASQFFTPNT